jgi:Glycosyl hydrolases family 16
MIEPPILVQYKAQTDATGATTRNVAIAYYDGDTVLVFTADGNARINGVSDSGGSAFSAINPGSYWQLWYCLSAKASTAVTVTSSGAAEQVTTIVAVFRGVSALGANTGFLTGSGTAISASAAISAGSKLVGMLGVAYNSAGAVTLSGDASGKTIHGSFRTFAGAAYPYSPLVALIDADAPLGSPSTPTLQLQASRSSNWEAIAIELTGQTPSYWLDENLYVIGDIIDSDGLVHSAVALTPSGLALTGSKGSFPCIPQNGGTPVIQTYAMGHVSSRFSFTYGTVEAAIKFTGVGVHAALWMLGVPSMPWPNFGSGPGENPPAGEIDIAEVFNNEMTNVHTAYANPSFVTADTPVGFDISAGFHVYKLVWAPGSLKWYVDGTQVMAASANVQNYPMYVMVGGYMGESGYPITDALLPTTMTVEYLNVTDADGQPVSNTGSANVIPNYPSRSTRSK